MGIPVLALPALSVEPITPLVTFAEPYDLIVFVSRAAVQYFPLDAVAGMIPTLMAAVGEQTAQAIRQRFGSETNIFYPHEGQRQDSEALWQVLTPSLASIRRVLIVRAEQGRNWLRDQFAAKGCQVDCLAVYARKPYVWSAEQVLSLTTALKSQMPLIWLFTSVESVDAVDNQFNCLGVQAGLAIQGLVVTHPKVLDRVRRLLATVDLDDLTDQKCRDVTPYQVVSSSDQEILQGLQKIFKYLKS